jgi:hypothetical protein
MIFSNFFKIILFSHLLKKCFLHGMTGAGGFAVGMAAGSDSKGPAAIGLTGMVLWPSG